MNSEKVKEIKKALECMSGVCKDSLTDICFNCEVDKKFDEESACKEALTLINELESENERLIKIKDNALEIIKQGEQQIINIAKETLKDFREKYKEALKEAVKGENVDCFVESLKIFDKTIEEKICDLK